MQARASQGIGHVSISLKNNPGFRLRNRSATAGTVIIRRRRRPTCTGTEAYVISGSRAPCRLLLCLHYCIVVARLTSINILRFAQWRRGTLSPIVVLLSHVPTAGCWSSDRFRYDLLPWRLHPDAASSVRVTRTHFRVPLDIFVFVNKPCAVVLRAANDSRSHSSGLLVKFKVSADDLSIANLFCSRISSVGHRKHPPPSPNRACRLDDC